jgi:hypothetical protein
VHVSAASLWGIVHSASTLSTLWLSMGMCDSQGLDSHSQNSLRATAHTASPASLLWVPAALLVVTTRMSWQEGIPP